jgi:hypothetical protein
VERRTFLSALLKLGAIDRSSNQAFPSLSLSGRPEELTR